MRILTDSPHRRPVFGRRCWAGLAGLLAALAGCGGEPSQRAIRNAQAFEALLTAVSLRHETEVEKDAKRIAERHDAGELTDENFRALSEIIAKARAKDWGAAAQRAYDFRKQFGDRGAYFD